MALETAAEPAVIEAVQGDVGRFENNQSNSNEETTQPAANPRDLVDRSLEAVADKIEQRDKGQPRQQGRFTKVEAGQQEPQKVAQGPLAWRADMKARFNSLPPDVQNYIMEREQSAHQRISQLGQAAAAGSGEAKIVSEIASRYKASLPQGMAATAAFEHLLAAHNELENNPERALRHLAENYGVPWGASDGTDGKEPSISELRGEIEAEARASALVDLFAKSKDDWDEIGDAVAEHAAAIRFSNPQMDAGEVLHLAYDRASKLSSKTAQKAEQAKKQEAEKAERDRAEKAREAKRNASLNVKSTASAPTRGTWEQTMDSFRDR